VSSLRLSAARRSVADWFVAAPRTYWQSAHAPAKKRLCAEPGLRRVVRARTPRRRGGLVLNPLETADPYVNGLRDCTCYSPRYCQLGSRWSPMEAELSAANAEHGRCIRIISALFSSRRQPATAECGHTARVGRHCCRSK